MDIVNAKNFSSSEINGEIFLCMAVVAANLAQVAHQRPAAKSRSPGCERQSAIEEWSLLKPIVPSHSRPEPGSP